MTRSAYIVGGAASGKSTFMAELLDWLGADLQPVEDLWSALKTNGAMVKFRGHRWDGGVYLGVQRELHPGADGLDKACQPAALGWVDNQAHRESRIVGEGALLSNEQFLSRLPHLLLVHLVASPEEVARRCVQRGTTQPATFIAGTATRARNAVERHAPRPVLTVDTCDAESWTLALDLVAAWLDLG